VTQKKVLITGGSGFLGINLIRFLLKKGFKIRSLDIAPFDYPEKDKIEAVLGDVRDRKMVNQAIRGVDFVVHCAAALPLYSKKDIFSTDVGGTMMVLRESLKQRVKRFIFISSTAVYGVPDHHPIKEDGRMIGVGPYGEAKIKAEGACLNYCKKGLPVTIIRPKTFIGPERLGVLAMLYQWSDEARNFPIIGKGDNRYQFLDVEDLCQFIYLCLISEKRGINGVFNVGAKEFSTFKEDFQSVLDRAGHGKKIISFPAAPAVAVLKILEFFKLSPLYQWIYETAGKDSYVSVEKAEKVLGFKPRYSNRQALGRNFDWYLKNRSAFESVSGVSHRVPWNQGALGLLKFFF